MKRIKSINKPKNLISQSYYKVKNTKRAYNKKIFTKILKDMIKEDKEENLFFGLAFIQVVDFTDIELGFDYRIGRKLTSKIKYLFLEELRDGELLGRFENGQFALCMTKYHTIKEIKERLLYILKTLSRPIKIENYEFHITYSMGVAFYPADTNDIEKLIQYGEIAIYHILNEKKSAITYYKELYNRQILKNIEIATNLTKAVEKNEIYMMFQPQVSLLTKEVKGVEALMRWNSTKLKVFPDEFIPIAEKTGLIISMGRRGLNIGLDNFKEFKQYGLKKIFFNISPKEFYEDDFIVNLFNEIKNNELSCSEIGIEITEGTLMHDLKKSQTIIKSLRSKDILIGIDDFGKGHASFEYLNYLDIDVLKIDKLFISSLETSPKSRIIVKSIIKMASEMGIEVIAEGIEKKSQEKILIGLGCEIGQGYLYSRPIEKESVENFLESKIK